MEPEPTLSKEIIEATNNYLEEIQAALPEKIRLARERKSASQRQARSQQSEEGKASERAKDAAAHQRARSHQTEEEKSSRRAEDAAAHTAARKRATSEYQEQCSAARALCHLGMEDVPPPEALFHFETDPNLALLAFWEHSGLESLPHVSEIPHLLGIIQDQKRKALDDLERYTKICHSFLAKLEAAHVEVPLVEVIRYLMAKSDEAVAVGKQSLHLFDESKNPFVPLRAFMNWTIATITLDQIAKQQAAGIEVPNMEALRDLLIAKLDEAAAAGAAAADDGDDGDRDLLRAMLDEAAGGGAAAAAAAADDDDDDDDVGDNDHVYGLGGWGGDENDDEDDDVEEDDDDENDEDKDEQSNSCYLARPFKRGG